MILHHDLYGWGYRKVAGVTLVGLVLTIVGLFCAAPSPEFGGDEGHGGFVAPVGSGD